MVHTTDPQEKMTAALGALLFFVPHFFGQRTEFVVFYMKQNFPLFLFFIAGTIFKMLFGWIPLIGAIVNVILVVLLFFTLVSMFLLAYHAYLGEKFEINFLVKFTHQMMAKIDFLKNYFSVKN